MILFILRCSNFKGRIIMTLMKNLCDFPGQKCDEGKKALRHNIVWVLGIF